jgi:hypothetical protein
MSDNDVPSVTGNINILPPDSHGDILVQLIRGQERSATALELQNKRLFGGDGMPGMLPEIIQQHKDLGSKLDTNKTELLDRIEAAKGELRAQIDAKKTDTDAAVKVVSDAQIALDRKVNHFTTVAATVNTIFLGAMAALGLYHKAH